MEKRSTYVLPEGICIKKKKQHCIGKQTDTYTYFLGISNFAKVPGKVKFILFYSTLDYSYKGYELLC